MNCLGDWIESTVKSDFTWSIRFRPMVASTRTLFVCTRWGVAREAISQTLGAQLTPGIIVPLMFQFEGV